MEDREEPNPHPNLQPVYPVYQLGTDHMGQQVFYGVQLGNEQMFAPGEIYQNAGNFQQIQPQFYSPASAPDGTQFVQQPHFVNQISPQVQQGQEQQLMNMYGMQNQFRQRQFYQPQQMQGQVNYAQPVYSQVVENSGSEPRSVSALFDNSSENYTANWVSSTSSIPPEQKVPPEGTEDIEPNDFGGTWPPTRSHRQPIPRQYEQTDGMMAGTSATSGGFVASSPPIQNHRVQKLEVQVGQISLNEQPRTNVYTQQTYLAYQQQPPQAFSAPQKDPELVRANMAAASMVANPVPHARPTYSDMVKRGAPPSQHVQVHITRKEPKDQAKAATALHNDRSKGKIPQRSQNGDRSIPGRGSANGDSERRRVPGSSESQQNPPRPSVSAQNSVRTQRNGPQPSTAPANPQTFDGNYHSPNGQKPFNPNRSYPAPSAQPAQYNWPRTASRTSTQPTSSRSVPPNSTETLHFDLTQAQNCPQQQHFNRPAPSHQIPFPQTFSVPPPNQQRLILNQPPPGCAMPAGPPGAIPHQMPFINTQMGLFRPPFPPAMPYQVPLPGNQFFPPNTRPLSPQNDYFRGTWLDQDHLPHDQLIAELTLLHAAHAHNNTVMMNKSWKNPPNTHGHVNSLLSTTMRLVNANQPTGFSLHMVGAVPGAQTQWRGGPSKPRGSGNRDVRRTPSSRTRQSDQESAKPTTSTPAETAEEPETEKEPTEKPETEEDSKSEEPNDPEHKDQQAEEAAEPTKTAENPKLPEKENAAEIEKEPTIETTAE